MTEGAKQYEGRRIHPDRLRRFSVRVMERCDLSRSQAEETAEVLVAADAWGVFTHGTRQLVPLMNNVRQGAIDAKASPQVISAEGGCALVDGRNAMPMVSSRLAMRTAIGLAREAGAAYAGVRHSNHFGAAGYYAMMAAEAKMIGIAMSNVDVCMSVPGAAGPVIGTNPIAYAVPAGRENPVFLDIATSVVAVSKVFSAKASGQPIPPGWLVNEEGHSSTDPNDYPEHATILPMAGHKGYGIALLIEVLSGVLTGSSFLGGIKRWVDDDPLPADQGHAFLAIDIERLMPLASFTERMEAMVSEVRSARKAGASGRIFLPGEMEWDRRSEAYRNGLALPDFVIENLVRVARDTDSTGALDFAFDIRKPQ